MLCYEQIGKKEESYIIANMLFEKLESKEVKDSVILRKVYLNLAINFDRLGFIQSAKKCAKKLTFLASILLQNIALQKYM